MEIIISLFLGFCVSFFSTPFVIRVSKNFGWVDNPKRTHPAILYKKAIPRAGGIPPLLGVFFSLTFLAATSHFFLTKQILGILIGAVILVVVGIFDDKYDLNPYLRLLFNFLVVLIVVGSGIGISWISNPFGGQIRLDSLIFSFNIPGSLNWISGPHSIVVLADIVAFIWIIWIMNALNWSSGVDGQLSGIAAIAFFVLGIASYQLLINDPSQKNTTLIAFASSGAFLGFLPWSFYPQKIMPGYGGATLAGFLIAVLSILSGAKLATILLILLVPLVDSFWAVVRRVLSRKNPVWGDRYHLHHQLLSLGWSVPKICLFYYFIGLTLGIASLNFDSQKKFFAIATLGSVIFALLLTSFIILKRFRIRKTNVSSKK
jgi:UDP-GlcNAc:undecaprenyl-phosphate GlcNAc-1-phosphate transferase